MSNKLEITNEEIDLKQEVSTNKDERIDKDFSIDNNEKPKKTSSKIIIIILAIIGTLFLIGVIFSTIFALVNINNTTIIEGVKVKGIDLKDLSIGLAKNKIEEELTKELKENIVLNYGEYSLTVNGEAIDAKYNIEEVIDKAYGIGRQGNIFENNYQILNCLINGINIEPELEYNIDILDNISEDINSKIPGGIKQYSYYIEDGKVVITPGKQGAVVKKQELKNSIIEAIKTSTIEDNEIQIPVEIVDPEEIDIEKIHNEIYTEPKNAYYVADPFVIYPHVVGVDFEITIEEAKSLIQSKSEEFVINLKYTTPEITTNQIGVEAFPNLLSSFYTRYDASNRNRSNNLELAAGKINGTVLMPGEEFSYNKVVGERTIEAGYKEAKIYSNGQIVDGLGGGICQISSTLYDAVLYANLQVTSRRNHQFTTSYIGAGLDATVVYGSTDFKFVNSRKYPIKIVAEVKNGIAKMEIYGVKEEVEYEVKLEPVVLNYIQYKTQYVTDNSLAPGQQVVKQRGSNGCKTVTYKYLLLNGEVISKTEISRDTYNAVPQIINVGK